MQHSTAVFDQSTTVAPEAASGTLAHVLAAWDESLRRANRDRTLGLEATRVMVEIRLHVNRRSGTAYPSQDLLAELLDMARPNVSRAIRRLRERGYLTTEQRTWNGRTHTLYRPGDATAPVSPEIPQPPVDVSPGIRISGDTVSPEIGATYLPRYTNPGVNPGRDPDPGDPGEGASRARARPTPEEPHRVLLEPDWMPPEQAMASAARVFKLTPAQVIYQSEQFRDHVLARGTLLADPMSAWTSWMRRVGPDGPMRDMVERKGRSSDRTAFGPVIGADGVARGRFHGEHLDPILDPALWGSRQGGAP